VTVTRRWNSDRKESRGKKGKEKRERKKVREIIGFGLVRFL
jgi:hypothetical protein